MVYFAAEDLSDLDGFEAERVILMLCAFVAFTAMAIGGAFFGGSISARAKNRLARGKVRLRQVFLNAVFGKDAVDKPENFTLVMAHSAVVKPKKQGKRLRYDYTYYLYGFFHEPDRLDSYAVEVKFGHRRVIPLRAFRLGAENIARVVSRLKDSDVSFFDKAGQELLRFTVPAVGTEEFAAECPIRFEQVIETELFYDYIRRFSASNMQK